MVLSDDSWQELSCLGVEIEELKAEIQESTAEGGREEEVVMGHYWPRQNFGKQKLKPDSTETITAPPMPQQQEGRKQERDPYLDDDEAAIIHRSSWRSNSSHSSELKVRSARRTWLLSGDVSRFAAQVTAKSETLWIG
eukprot:590922-Amphidinium_carterae.4